METYDSSQNKLAPNDIIAIAVHQQDLGGVDPSAAMLAIVTEASQKNVETKQIGNTLFIGCRGTGKKKNLVYGRALNVDTAENFYKNSLQYAAYLQSKGVTQYATEFNYEGYVQFFKRIARYIKSRDADTSMKFGSTEDGSYVALFVFGKVPIL